MRAAIQAFFDRATSTASYLVSDPATKIPVARSNEVQR